LIFYLSIILAIDEGSEHLNIINTSGGLLLSIKRFEKLAPSGLGAPEIVSSGKLFHVPSIINPLLLSKISLKSSFSWASLSKSSGSSSISGSGGGSYPSSSAGRGGLKPLFKSLFLFLASFSFLILETYSYFRLKESSLYLSTNSLIYVLMPDPF
jgi:hypothetical protein